MYFDKCNTMEELKKLYKDLIKENHPDLNPAADWKVMAKINTEYEKTFEILKKASTNKTEQAETAQEYPEIILKLLKLHGLTIEICGAWLWISGNTYGNRKSLDELGCNWASQKKMWFWRPEEAKCYHNRSHHDMGYIRAKYGSSVLQTREPDLIPGH